MSHRKSCKECGRRLPDSFPTVINVQECEAMYRNGATLKEIAKVVGASWQWVHGRLEALGVPMRRTGPRTENGSKVSLTKAQVRKALKEHGSSRKAAKALGVSHVTVLNRLKKGGAP